MDDVIENCHNTFEEDGVSQQTLEDLKTVSGPTFPSCHFLKIYFLHPKRNLFLLLAPKYFSIVRGDFNPFLWQGPCFLGSPGGRFGKWEFGRFWELPGI